MSKNPGDILKELLKKAEKVFTALNPFLQDEVIIPYPKEIEGSTKQRIHNDGKDSNEQTIGLKSKYGGKYSPGYDSQPRIALSSSSSPSIICHAAFFPVHPAKTLPS